MVGTLLAWAVLGTGGALLLALCGVYWYMKRGREQHATNQLAYEEF